MRRIEGPGKRRIVLGVGGGGPLFSVDGGDDEDIVVKWFGGCRFMGFGWIECPSR
jgi:hypothetical protein